MSFLRLRPVLFEGQGTLRLSSLVCLALVLPCILMNPHAGAQEQVVVESLQGLSFEDLEGNGETIPVSDAARRAEWVIRGRSSVEVTLLLPNALVSPEGRGKIPLEFDFGDLAYLLPGSSDPILAHPRHPLVVHLSSESDQVRIFLGGTAKCSGREAAGEYEALISLLLTAIGGRP